MKRLSVEISTWNRKDILRLVLEGLARQTCPADCFEVVIADDGSSDGTAELVESLRPSLPYETRFVSHQHRGPAATHNLGIRHARGEIVLLLADDILPQPDLIDQHLAMHAQYPEETVIVVGRLVQSPDLPPTGIQKGWNAIVATMFPQRGTLLDYRNFWVSHLSFKREFMLARGMFREWPAASHEDLELGYRLQKQGMTLMFNPRALGHHHHPETLASIAGRSRAYGRNWHFLEAEVPETWVRVRSGNVRPTDGVILYLKTRLKQGLRLLFVNRLTIPTLAVPFAQWASRFPILTFLMPFLTRKIASYAFHCGLRDHRADQARERSLRAQADPQQTDAL